MFQTFRWSSEILDMSYRAYFDCSYRHTDPTRYGIGYAVVDPQGRIVKTHTEAIPLRHGGTAETYVKEKRALLGLVRELVRLKVRKVTIFGDHDKLVATVKKYHKYFLVHKPKTLEQLRTSPKGMSQLLACLRQIPEWKIEVIPSNKNVLADFLAKEALGVRRSMKIGLLQDFDHTTVEHITWLAG
jgi:hypothetical protein